MNWKPYPLVAASLLAVDWGLGVAVVRSMLPLWSFLVLNFPCAIPYVWMESHWAGTHYEVRGQAVNETWSFALFLAMIITQAALYTWCLGRLSTARRKQNGPDATAHPAAD